MKKNAFRTLIPAGIVVLGLFLFIYLKITRPESPPVKLRQRAWPVKTMIAEPKSLAPVLTLYGQIETPDRVNATAPGKSRILSITVYEGDRIQKGQVLLALDPRDFQPRVDQARAKVAELQALIKSEQIRYQADKQAWLHEQNLLNLEKAAVKRARKLKEKKLGSLASLESAKEEMERQQLAYTTRKMSLDEHPARLQQLQARLDYAQAELQLALLALERSRIIAPFDGYIEKRLVSIGDQVQDNQTLLTFYPDKQLEVRATIPATFQQELQAALNRGDKLVAQATIAATSLTLQLDRLAGNADVRGIDALFKISTPVASLRPGSTLTLYLQRPPQQQAVIIPFSAMYDNHRIYKYRQGRLQGLHVQHLGEYRDKNGQIKLLVASPDLHRGDHIVITQLPNAINGLPVHEITPQPEAK